MWRRLTYVAVALAVLGIGAGLTFYVLGRTQVKEGSLRSGVTADIPLPPIRDAEQSEAGIHLPPGVLVSFVDVTRKAGIRFQHFNGRTDKDYIMETMGSGLGWLDYDQDGLMDLFLVQSSTFVPPHASAPPPCKLFKNLGNGTFRDVTEEVGLGGVGCGMGVAVGDIDNDGFPDLFVTCYGKPNVLYHNVSDGKGGRRFVDITARAGLADHPDWHSRPNFSTSAAFLDYNNDGHLDLFVCSYVHVDLAHYPNCRDKRGRLDNCAPTAFQGTSCVLYRNNGDLTFTEVSHESGIDLPNAKALGVVALDLDGDGLVDIFVANDSVPNFLFRNLGNGRFESAGPGSGCAVNLGGYPQGYMGVDADDLDGDGQPDLFVTALTRETCTFFRNERHGQFVDATQGSGLGPPTWWKLGFGTCFLDVDHDGALDIVLTNGHVSKIIDEHGNPDNTFRQKPQMFLNDGQGHFQHISKMAGDYFQERHVGRGLAACDYDNDGRMDLAFSNNCEPAVLLHNETTTPYHWLRLELQGVKSNRDAVGARVTVQIGDRKLVRHRKGGGSYLSASDPRLHFGVGSALKVDQVEIRWPSGRVQRLGPLDADRAYLVIEGDDHPYAGEKKKQIPQFK